MTFLTLVLAIVIGVLLASTISLVITFNLLSNPKVIKWYTKYVMKMMEKYEEELDNLEQFFG